MAEKFCLAKTCIKCSANQSPLASVGLKHVLVVNQVFKWFSDLASMREDIPKEKEESRTVASQLRVLVNVDIKGRRQQCEPGDVGLACSDSVSP